MTKPNIQLQKLSFVVLAGLGVTVALADAARAAMRPHRRPRAGSNAAQRRQWAQTCLQRIYRGANVGDAPAHFVPPRSLSRTRPATAR